MKRILTVLLCVSAAYGQWANPPASGYATLNTFLGALAAAQSGSSLPGSCTAGKDFYILTTDTPPSLNYCDATNHWSKLLLSANNLSDLANAGTARASLGLGTAATQPATAFQTAGKISETVTAVSSSPYTVLTADSFLACDATSGAITINLPAASGSGREITVKKLDSTTNACTLTRAGSDTIDGATTVALSVQYAAAKLIDRASANWGRMHVEQVGGDVSGPSTAMKVTGINSVPLCTGFTPTNGQLLQYTTGGSPSPCYTAATVSAGGTGNAAAPHAVSFSATPTFGCTSATAGTVDVFTVAALTGNVTSSTASTCTPGQLLVFDFVQDATGSRTIVMPTGFDTAQISPTPSAHTKLVYSYGVSTSRLLAVIGDSGDPTVYGSEQAAAGTPASGKASCWFDSTDHTGLECKANNSATVYRMLAATLDTDGTAAANSDARVPSQKAMVTYVAAHGGGLPSGTPNKVLATDASGSSSNTVALRTLVSADLPPSYSVSATGGASNAYVGTMGSGCPAAYVVNEIYQFTADAANTASATFNFCTLGAKTIKKLQGTANLASGDIAANAQIQAMYDGTNMQMIPPPANAPGGSIVNASLGTGAASISRTATAGVGGVTAKYLAAKDATDPTRRVLPASGGCGGGIAATTATVGNAFELFVVPGTVITGVADNAVTAGHILVGGTSTPGRVLDSGQTSRKSIASSTCVIGVALQSATTGADVLLEYDGPGSFGAAIQSTDLPVTPLASGTSVSLTAPRGYYVCTSTCTVTLPVPAAGYEFCVRNGMNVSTVITLAALGSSAMYEKTDSTAYGTAGTGTMVSAGAVGDKVCIIGLDPTHYVTMTSGGTWTVD